MRLEVLFEDNHLLAVVKPVGIATMGAAENQPSLLAAARRYIRTRYQKPGRVYLGVMSRLDALVSGVVLFARTSKAAARMTEQFAGREVSKLYWAIVEGSIEPAEATLVDYVMKDDRNQRMRTVRRPQPGAKKARLSYKLLRPLKQASLLEVQLETGRKHQIRLQLSTHGFPILGDAKYGAQRPFPAGIALHARRLAFEHPVQHTTIELTAPVPKAWRPWEVVDA